MKVFYVEFYSYANNHQQIHTREMDRHEYDEIVALPRDQREERLMSNDMDQTEDIFPRDGDVARKDDAKCTADVVATLNANDGTFAWQWEQGMVAVSFVSMWHAKLAMANLEIALHKEYKGDGSPEQYSDDVTDDESNNRVVAIFEA